MAATLPRRTLGRTGLEVTTIGLGLAALGRPGYINLGHAGDLERDYDRTAMEAHAHAVLDAAWSSGVRYLDAARSYGAAEDFLASWLAARAIPSAAVTVGSKWGYTYTAAWRADADVNEVKDHGRATLDRQIEESRALLDGQLDLYQIHSATLETGVLDDPAVRERLAELRAGGLAIGLSTSGPDQAGTIRRALEVGGFDTVQATWNLHERSAGDALAEADAAGFGVIVKEAVANGRLTDRGADPRLRAAAAEHATTPDAIALAAVLARPWATIVLSGAATIDQLRSNLRAIDVVWNPKLEASLAPLAEDAEAYWTTRAALPWN